MKLKMSVWSLLAIVSGSLVIGVVLDRMALSVYWDFTHIGRDLNELEPELKLGMRQENVIRALGTPTITTRSVDDLEPYRVSPPDGEKVMLYAEYPWGILVYVNKKQSVSRLILMRSP